MNAAGWRPIEDADRAADGLVWNGHQRGEATFEDGAWFWINGHDIDPPPTHWAPMPDPPPVPIFTRVHRFVVKHRDRGARYNRVRAAIAFTWLRIFPPPCPIDGRRCPPRVGDGVCAFSCARHGDR
jgi:hypothetical protein